MMTINEDRRKLNNNLQGDIWTDEDDAMLAEAILRNVRGGGTVIDGCKEFDEATNGKRTASANKFRWFTRLVNQYKGGYELAKIEGKKVKQSKKRKVNQGERYKEIIENVFEDDQHVEKVIEPDDFIVLAKKFKEQQGNKVSETAKLERKIKELEITNSKLDKELTKSVQDIALYADALEAKKRDYNKVVEALQTLKTLGIQVNVPEEEKTKYAVDKNGVVSKL